MENEEKENKDEFEIKIAAMIEEGITSGIKDIMDTIKNKCVVLLDSIPKKIPNSVKIKEDIYS